MLEHLVSIGSTFDWITPAAAYVQDLIRGPSFTFMVPHPCAWSGREIAHLLKRHGIRSWGLMIVKNILLITVSEHQARWASYLLQREGIPMLQGPHVPSAAAKAAASCAAPRARLEIAERCLDKVASLLGF